MLSDTSEGSADRRLSNKQIDPEVRVQNQPKIRWKRVRGVHSTQFSLNTWPWLALLALVLVYQVHASIWDGIPVISQVKSAFQALSGDVEAAERTQENFFNYAPGVSQLRSAVQAGLGDREGAKETQEKFWHGMMLPILENTPIVGHIIAVGYELAGDRKRGQKILRSATTSTASVIGGILAGPGGAIAAGAGMDTLITGLDSVVYREFRPHGVHAFAESAAQGKATVGDVFDFVTGLVGETVGGHGARLDVAKGTAKGAGKKAKEGKEVSKDVNYEAKSKSASGLSGSESSPNQTDALKYDYLDVSDPGRLASARLLTEKLGLQPECSKHLTADDFRRVNDVKDLNCYFCSAAAAKRLSVSQLVNATRKNQYYSLIALKETASLMESLGFKSVVPIRTMMREQFQSFLENATLSSAPGKLTLLVGVSLPGLEHRKQILVVVAWWSDGQTKILVKDYANPPIGSGKKRFSAGLPVNATEFYAIQWNGSILASEDASEVEKFDLLSVRDAYDTSDCPLCALAGVKGVTVEVLMKQLESGRMPIAADFLVDLYKQAGLPDVHMSGPMRAQELPDYLDTQLKTGEQSQFTLVYWRPRLSRIHAIQARAWKDSKGVVHLLTIDFQHSPQSKGRFSCSPPEGVAWLHVMQIVRFRLVSERSVEEDALRWRIRFEQLRAKASGGGNKCSAGTRIIGYIPSWSKRLLTTEQSLSLTNSIFAFMQVDERGKLSMPDHTMARERLICMLRARKANFLFGLKQSVSFAIGGWQNSQHFSSIMSSPSLRKTLISEIQRMIDTYEFDGVDFNWEHPVAGGVKEGKPEDRQNYVSFLAQLRSSLGPNKLISVAAGAEQEAIAGYDVEGLLKHVDWLAVESYDFYGAWNTSWGAIVGPHAALKHSAPPGYSGKLNADWALKQYVCASGEPAQHSKIVMGIPFNGHYWYQTKAVEMNGKEYPMFRRADRLNNGSFGGELAYYQVKDEWNLEQQDKFKKNWNEKSSTAWATDGSLVLSYENERSIAAKVKYAIDHNLGGVSVWALDQDDRNLTLLSEVFKGACYTSSSKRDLKYACNPLGDEKRWWTLLESEANVGLCGKEAPLHNGYYPVCDPDDAGYSCCGVNGHCGSGKDYCDCQGCQDYAKHPELLTQEPLKPSGPIRWHVGSQLAKHGEARCGWMAPRLADGQEAICNPESDNHCCSRLGDCGSGDEFCLCQGCVDHANSSRRSELAEQSEPVGWHVGFRLAKEGQPRCGSLAPRLASGREAICNPYGSNHCCSRWGFCGSGKSFCNCTGCVDYRNRTA